MNTLPTTPVHKTGLNNVDDDYDRQCYDNQCFCKTDDGDDEGIEMPLARKNY